MTKEVKSSRRRFFKIVSATGIGAAVTPILSPAPAFAQKTTKKEKPKTNIAEALNQPRVATSMPGAFPAKVVKAYNKKSVENGTINEAVANQMLEKAMLSLTSETDIVKAWLKFVKPTERIGLKVNPVAGEQLTTSHAVVKAVIKQLEQAGVPRKNITIWDRREMQLHETGFTNENYPDIRIMGTEQKDAEGGYHDKDGKLYGEKMIDREWYYWTEVMGEYDEETLPYMVNKGDKSYFSKIVTQELDKIINIPIMKNAGKSITLCLKNLAYGAISNTGRLHKKLWAETIAQVCAFPPIRDKVVLNIGDGLKGCYNGGPSAQPQFFCDYHTLLVGTDAVAVDRVAYDIIIKKRIEEKIQEEDHPYFQSFLKLANEYGLGENDLNKIDLKEV